MLKKTNNPIKPKRTLTETGFNAKQKKLLEKTKK